MIPGDYHGTDSGVATEILSCHTRMHEQAKQQYGTRSRCDAAPVLVAAGPRCGSLARHSSNVLI